MAKPTKLKTTEVLVPEETQSTAINPAQGFMSAAIAQGASPDAIEKMVDLWQMVEERKAAAAMDRALAQFQSDCPVVTKERKGYGGHYKYATLPTIVEQVRPLLTRHGLAFTFASRTHEENVSATCTVTHDKGGQRSSTFECPIDNNQKNSMSMPQRYGAAVTFAKRYALINALGILCADEDDDCFSAADKVDASATNGVAAAKSKLWAVGKRIHGGDVKVYESFLHDQEFIDGPLADQGEPQLTRATALVVAFLALQDSNTKGGNVDA